MKKSMRILIFVVIAIVVGYIIYSVVSNLLELEEVTQESLPIVIEGLEATFELCESSEFGTSEQDKINQKKCQEQMQFNVEMCDIVGNPPECNDPRIQKYLP